MNQNGNLKRVLVLVRRHRTRRPYLDTRIAITNDEQEHEHVTVKSFKSESIPAARALGNLLREARGDGQATLQHTKKSTYGCFRQDLTGFSGIPLSRTQPPPPDPRKRTPGNTRKNAPKLAQRNTENANIYAAIKSNTVHSCAKYSVCEHRRTKWIFKSLLVYPARRKTNVDVVFRRGWVIVSPCPHGQPISISVRGEHGVHSEALRPTIAFVNGLNTAPI